MADYDRFLRWQKSVVTSEIAYKKKIRGAWGRHRSQMVDVVSTYGVKSPFLVNQLLPIFESLQREVEQIGSSVAPDVISKSTSYVSTQLDQARTFIPDVPDVDQLTLAVGLPTIRTGSVAVLQGRVISTLPRLSAEDRRALRRSAEGAVPPGTAGFRSGAPPLRRGQGASPHRAATGLSITRSRSRDVGF